MIQAVVSAEADARERERGQGLRERAGEHRERAERAGDRDHAELAESVADRPDDELNRTMRERIGGHHDRGGADRHADVGGDLRQQGVRGAHHRLRGEAREREQRDRAGRRRGRRGRGR